MGILNIQNKNITLNISGAPSYAIGIYATSDDLNVDVGTRVNLTTDTLTINNKTNSNKFAGIHAERKGAVNINAKDIVIDAGPGSAIAAVSRGSVAIEGNLTINAKTAIAVRSGAQVTINESGSNTVKISGNIASSPNNWYGSEEAGVSLKLTNAESSWTGNALLKGKGGQVFDFSLALENQAQWNLGIVDLDTYREELKVNNLTLNGGVINTKSDEQKVLVENLSGTGGVFNATTSTDGSTIASSQLVVDSTNGTPQIVVNAVGIDADQIDDVNAAVESFRNNALNIKEGEYSAIFNINEGLYNGAIVSDQNGTKQALNSIMRDTLDIASGSTVMLNRILMNDVHKRLGDLRNNAGMNGAWVRYDGGRLSGNHVANKFNTIQLGADMPFADNFHAGVSASYTRGDVDFTRGGAGMDAYSLAAYGTWFAPNGMYADVVARYGYVKNELTVDHNLKGDLDNNALALSGEFGWKFDVAKDFFVTPQVEASYMHIDSDTVKLGNKASYKFDSVDSFIGRAGLAAGYTFPNQKGNVFVKVSAVHEFAGDSKVTGANGTSLKKDGKDTWAEFGVGAQYNFNKNVQAWANLERTAGADIEEDYRATVGVRINF